MIARHRHAAYLVSVCALLAGSAVAAEPDLETRARELYSRGNVLYDKGQNAEAEAVYEEAWKLRQTYDLAGNLAQAELKQGKPLEALPHLRYALDNAPLGSSKKKRAAIEAAYTNALAAVALLRITVTPSDAEVVVDGPEAAKLPEGLAVQPGERLVRASKAGFIAAEERFSVKAGEQREVRLTLAPEPVQPAVGPVASAAQTAAPPPSAVPDDSPWPDKTLVLWAGGGTAAALGITGVVLTVLSNGKASDADDQKAALAASNPPVRCTTGAGNPAACDELASSQSAKDDLANGALWTLVGAGAVGLGTLGYWLWAPDGKEASTQVKATPVVSNKQAGLWLEGTFQ